MQLREARRAELADFAAMERQADAAGFILPDTLADHEVAFDRRGVIDLAIEADDASLAGIILIAPEAGGPPARGLVSRKPALPAHLASPHTSPISCCGRREAHCGTLCSRRTA